MTTDKFKGDDQVEPGRLPHYPPADPIASRIKDELELDAKGQPGSTVTPEDFRVSEADIKRAKET